MGAASNHGYGGEHGPLGLMDMASDFSSEGCGAEPCRRYRDVVVQLRERVVASLHAVGGTSTWCTMFTPCDEGCVSQRCLEGRTAASAHADVLCMRVTLDENLRDWGLTPGLPRDRQEYEPPYDRGIRG